MILLGVVGVLYTTSRVSPTISHEEQLSFCVSRASSTRRCRRPWVVCEREHLLCTFSPTPAAACFSFLQEGP